MQNYCWRWENYHEEVDLLNAAAGVRLAWISAETETEISAVVSAGIAGTVSLTIPVAGNGRY